MDVNQFQQFMVVQQQQQAAMAQQQQLQQQQHQEVLFIRTQVEVLKWYTGSGARLLVGLPGGRTQVRLKVEVPRLGYSGGVFRWEKSGA
uniref:Uncharacterized protein n=1 Tax=Ditylenchus dipsaci TaxID=166011 RepID=A0A915EDY4_9BILA